MVKNKHLHARSCRYSFLWLCGQFLVYWGLFIFRSFHLRIHFTSYMNHGAQHCQVLKMDGRRHVGRCTSPRPSVIALTRTHLWNRLKQPLWALLWQQPRSEQTFWWIIFHQSLVCDNSRQKSRHFENSLSLNSPSRLKLDIFFHFHTELHTQLYKNKPQASCMDDLEWYLVPNWKAFKCEIKYCEILRTEQHSQTSKHLII